MQRYEISIDPARLDLSAIHAFLTQAYWSLGVPLATVAKAVQNSVCVGAYLGQEQIGFARAITDGATFAYFADVYVLEGHRGSGLSRRMMEELTAHPELQGLRRMLLVTRDAHGLYEKFGFKRLSAPDRFMELHKPNAYSPQPSTPA
ncbi:N-acetyltransferase [Variovorax atrisoli]|uniref:GNAT family N-acetyltransferase n=1 Tax=Variovorax atrisoli TaxID=3394203 RepID=UPI000F7E6251|nr:GNAT family N-acetyltransferase [Variovorax sp. 369]RTD94651.1 N-acetyltransferase [Variovorax sp. 369]